MNRRTATAMLAARQNPEETMDIPRSYDADAGLAQAAFAATAALERDDRAAVPQPEPADRAPANSLEQLGNLVKDELAHWGMRVGYASADALAAAFLKALASPSQAMLDAMGSTHGIRSLVSLAKIAQEQGFSATHPPGYPSVMEQAWRAAIEALGGPAALPLQEGERVVFVGIHGERNLFGTIQAIRGDQAWVLWETVFPHDLVPVASLERVPVQL